MALTLGCESAASERDAQSSPDGGSHTAQDDASGSAQGLEPGQPPPRGCAVVRSITLPERSTLLTSLGQAPIVRVPRGFVVGLEAQSTPDTTNVHWRVLSEDGARQVERSGAGSPQLTLALFPIGRDPFAGAALHVFPSPGREQVASQLVSGSGAGPVHELGPAFYRGSIQKAGAASLDGRRAVYVTGHVGVDGLHAFVMDERGERVGGVVPLGEDESPLTDCLQVIPTQTAATVGFVDKGIQPPELRVYGLSSQGEVVASASLPLADGSCPFFLQATASGLAVQLATHDDSFDLRILRSPGRPSWSSPAPPLQGELRTRWVHERAPDDLLVLFHASGEPRLARWHRGGWTLLDAQLPAIDSVVPAESGRLFAVSGSTSARGQLHEIACGDLDD